MEEFTVEVQQRTETGSSANRRYRRAGMIPSVVYSHGEETVVGLLTAKEFLRRAETATSSQVFTIKSKDAKHIDNRSAIVKEVQIDRLRNKVLHVDFQVLKENEEITLRIPLKFSGESIGVKDQGGVLSVATHELIVRCLPRSIPRVINVEVAALGIGDSIHAEELKLPEGVKLGGNPGETIVSVVVPKTVVEETATAVAGAEGAVEGAEGAPAAAAADGAAAAPAEGAGKDEKAAGKPSKK